MSLSAVFIASIAQGSAFKMFFFIQNFPFDENLEALYTWTFEMTRWLLKIVPPPM